MTMNITLGRILRVISHRGRYALCWVSVDDDGEIVKIHSGEEVDTSFKNLDELKEVIALINEAKVKPVFVITPSTKYLISREE